jgi:hypothetical protein
MASRCPSPLLRVALECSPRTTDRRATFFRWRTATPTSTFFSARLKTAALLHPTGVTGRLAWAAAGPERMARCVLASVGEGSPPPSCRRCETSLGKRRHDFSFAARPATPPHEGRVAQTRDHFL